MVKLNNSLVSVVIPTYKRSDMLKRAIESVLNQSHTDIEVIVVDDNDPNSKYRKATQTTMQQYINNEKVNYIKHAKNLNGSVARNTGIQHSNGKYICFLDDDNYYYENKIEIQYNYLKNNLQHNAVYCGYNKDGEIHIPRQEGDLTFEQLSGMNIIDTNSIMMCKSDIVDFGGWDIRLTRNQDVAFMIRYFSTGNTIGVVEKPLFYYDLADRSNVADPKKNENNTNQFLSLYRDFIEELSKNNSNIKKKIYAYRYRAVFLNYLKNKDYINSLKLYYRLTKLAPFEFNKLIFETVTTHLKK